MKKFLFTLILIFMFVMNANALESDYKINSYDINISINENNTMHIIEYIDVNFNTDTISPDTAIAIIKNIVSLIFLSI